jgi:pimeloyl-ACP methyl ester carboxylesterase
MTPREYRVSAWDGLALHATSWGEETGAPPLFCLPGLVRTGEDFSRLAQRHAGARRVVAMDYAGRGRSAWAPKVTRYAPEAMLRDILDVAASLSLHRVVLVGTSFGGLMAMAIAAVRPGLLRGVVLNDIGPEIGAAGEAFVRRFVAEDPALPDLAAASRHLRTLLPYLSFTSDEDWQEFARLTYALGADGRWHPRWDRRIADLLVGPARDLWPFFDALAGIKLMLVHGGASTLLLGETVARMRARRPDMAVTTIADVGHAPSLAEPAAAAAIDRFLASL